MNSIFGKRGALQSLIIIAALAGAAPLWAGEIPRAEPEEVGMSTERLKRIDAVMQRHMDAGDIQGGITIVARRGKVVHYKMHGLMDVEAKTPMAKDALFRMASSTKPILGVAAMMMIEEGLIRPSDRASQYIPELADMKVAVLKDGAEFSRAGLRRGELPEYELVPAEREITIHHLLTHTSGLMSSGLGSAVARRGRRGPDATLASYIPTLGEVPLDFQPGTRWQYSPGTGLDVVARIIEIVSGQPFDVFLRERIFKPLGMNSTFFNVPEEHRSRLVKIAGQDLSRFAGRGPTKYFSASGGLTSSAEDYLRFEQMLYHGGELFGNRLLSPRSVRMMASNQSGDLYQGLVGGQGGMGFGYTVAVVLDPILSDSRRGKGAFGWGGAFGTMSWTDPKEEITAVIMLQQRHQPTQNDFGNAIRQAIID